MIKNGEGWKAIDIEIDLKGPDAVQHLMIQSDTHGDNAKADRELHKRCLDWARENNAIVIDLGDMFDAMQGKRDPRSSKASLRPEDCMDDYLGSILRHKAEFLAPYADLFAVLGMGNHETAIVSHNDINLTRHLGMLLRPHGFKGVCADYEGYIRLKFKLSKTVKARRLIYWTHGAGGGGPVTRGAIKTNRRAVNEPDADFVLSGHIHDSWIIPIPQRRVDHQGGVSMRNQIHIQVPSLKIARMDPGSWEAQREMNHKPKGVVVISFTKRCYNGGYEIDSEQRLRLF